MIATLQDLTFRAFLSEKSNGKISKDWENHPIIESVCFSILNEIRELCPNVAFNPLKSDSENAVEIYQHTREAIKEAKIHVNTNQSIAGMVRDVSVIQERGEAVVEAAKNGDLESVANLLAEDAQISSWHRGEALKEAVHAGSLEIVQILLQEGAIIFPEHRGEALVDAVRTGHFGIFQALLAGDSAQIGKKQSQDAVRRIVKHGLWNMFSHLLNEHRDLLSQDLCKEALLLAAEYGRGKIAIALLDSPIHISRRTRGKALMLATEFGREKIMDRLLGKHSKIPKKYLDRAEKLALHFNNHKIAERLREAAG